MGSFNRDGVAMFIGQLAKELGSLFGFLASDQAITFAKATSGRLQRIRQGSDYQLKSIGGLEKSFLRPVDRSN
jgi:hypothetical protein